MVSIIILSPVLVLLANEKLFTGLSVSSGFWQDLQGTLLLTWWGDFNLSKRTVEEIAIYRDESQYQVRNNILTDRIQDKAKPGWSLKEEWKVTGGMHAFCTTAVTHF